MFDFEDEKIIQIIRKHKSVAVSQLVDELSNQEGYSEDFTLEAIERLKVKGLVRPNYGWNMLTTTW